MNYEELLTDHTVIEGLSRLLLGVIGGAEPDVDAACFLLQRLALRTRDHFAAEDPMLYATAHAATGTRHAPLVSLSIEDFAQLKDSWARFLYRWDRQNIESNWLEFGKEAEAVLEQIHDRVMREQMVLYSIALHFGVLTPTR